MAEKVRLNSTLISGRKDSTLTYSKYVKDEESGKTMEEILDGKRDKSNLIDTNDMADNAVTIPKLADEVWNKLKAEYLRLDGNNAMSGTLDMDDNAIINPEEISATKLRAGGSQVFSLNLLGEEGITLSISSMSSGRHSSQECVMSSDGTWEAKGFYTTERSNLGLLNNNAEVVLAMSDSDVDACFQTVFV